MKQSNEIKQIAAALVKAQAELKAVAKDATNPHFRNRYASLDAIIDAVRPVLVKHGLAVIQGAVTPESDAENRVTAFTVETTLLHTSGEWLSSAVVVPLVKADPQGAGGALTYGRRYSLSALLCLATEEDDDANHATQPAARTEAPKAKPVASKPAQNGGGKAWDRPMPFGKTKGKKLGEHTVEELERTRDWCADKDAEKFKDLIAALDDVIEAKAVPAGVVSALDLESFPPALRDDGSDDLPF